MAECYRHPGRETNVQCSNCGRPICPDCMTVTPVGMRCPECARERTKVTRITPGIHLGRAPATYVLIALNVIAFIAEVGSGAPLGTSFSAGGSVFRDFSLFGPAVANGEWYRIVTAGFLHAGLLHILFNMVALYFLGSFLEPGIGTPRFLGVYFVSLLAGSFGALLFCPDALTVVAPGAIFGLFVPALMSARGRGLGPAASQLGILLVINFALTFSLSGISIGGHV